MAETTKKAAKKTADKKTAAKKAVTPAEPKAVEQSPAEPPEGSPASVDASPAELPTRTVFGKTYEVTEDGHRLKQ